MFNATCEWLQKSALPEAQSFAVQFSHAWVTSLELRITVYVIVLQMCCMAWITSMVREIMKTATTVLCKLLVYDTAVSTAPCSRTLSTDAVASAPHTRHKTAGGPPPGTPPPLSSR